VVYLCYDCGKDKVGEMLCRRKEMEQFKINDDILCNQIVPVKNGKLIVIEGACDGIGKSTQYDMLYRHFQMDGEEVVHHHFPSYGTYQGAPVERYLEGTFGQPSDLSPYFVNALYANDRGITWYIKLKKFYEQGKIILLDRYTTSSLIYQSALMKNINDKKNFIDYVIDYEYHKIGIREPDSVIFLHAPLDLVTEIRNA
jgi:dTMP kinase